jgi:sporulation protein YlmC with PRC-barrel domain
MKTMAIVVLVCSFVIIGGAAFGVAAETGPPVWIQGGPGQQPMPGEPNPVGPTCFLSFEPTGWDLFEASWLIGHQVFSPDDSYLGQIGDLVIDQSNGRIALAILSDVPGFGAKSVAVPYGSLTRIMTNIFQINLPYQPIGYNNTAEYDREMAAGVVPPAIDSSWASFVYTNYGLTPYWEQKGEQPLMQVYKSSILMGAEVRSPEGENMARVDDLVINSSDGQVILLSLRDVAGKGDTLVAIPFSILSRSEGNTFALSIAKEKLAGAPRFNEPGDMSSPKWAQNDYSFFGVQPCWTEGGSGEYK